MFRRIFPLAAVLALVLAGLAFFAARSITIEDLDGRHTLRAPVLTTAQALSAAGLTLDPADQVSPALSRPIPLDGIIHVRRAAQVTLSEDGSMRHLGGIQVTPARLLAENGVLLAPQDRLLRNGQPVVMDETLLDGVSVVWQLVRAHAFVLDAAGQHRPIASSADSLARALWDAGVQIGPGDRVSAPLSDLPGSQPVISVQSARAFTIHVDGQTRLAYTTASTVGASLAEAGVVLEGLDTSLPAENQPLPVDGTVRVVRVREEISLTATYQPFEQKYVSDPDLEANQRKVIEPGQNGVTIMRARARFEDDQEIRRTFDSDWVASAPKVQTVAVGGKIVPHTLDAPAGPVEYWQAVNVYATSYWPCEQGTDGCSWSTSSGARLTKGIIAVTLSWYRQMAGLRVYVPGYGYGVIGDVGGGIPGKPWIDLGFDQENANEAFTGWVTMYLLMPAPANAPLTLP